MKNRAKFVSLLVAVCMMITLLPAVALAAPACGHTEGDANCTNLPCKVAAMINALPAKDAITIDNAADVIDRIHAIDRVKFDLKDDEYDAMMVLVTDKKKESLSSEVYLPTRYFDAIAKVEALLEGNEGGSFYISKEFLAENGDQVNVSNAEVKFKLTKEDTNASQTLTLFDMGSTMSEFYSANAEGDGWTYKYLLPAGTYTIEEVSDSGATVDGQPFVTGSTAYKFNGEEIAEGATIEVKAGERHNVVVYNKSGHAHPVCGASCSCGGSHPTLTDWEKLTWDGTNSKLLANGAAVTQDSSSGYYTLSGNYYLGGDIPTGIKVKTTTASVLCLNGYSISSSDTAAALLLDDNTNLTVTDCKTTGEIENTSSGKAVDVGYAEHSNIVFTLYNGTLESSTGYAYGDNGGTNNTFYQYGGTVVSSGYRAAFVGTGSGQRYYLYGGSVENRIGAWAVDVTGDDATLSMSGDVSITGNISVSNPITIAGALTKDSPKYTVRFTESSGSDKTGTFTSGWDAEMSSEKIEDYFVPYNPNTYEIKKTDDGEELQMVRKGASQPIPTPTPTPGSTTPTAPSGYSGPDLWYIGGNTFGTTTTQAPTKVEIDGVAVPFTMNGSKIVVGCVEPDAKWICASWGSTSNTLRFTPDAAARCAQVSIPKTGDVSAVAFALMAVIAAAGALGRK